MSVAQLLLRPRPSVTDSSTSLSVLHLQEQQRSTKERKNKCTQQLRAVWRSSRRTSGIIVRGCIFCRCINSPRNALELLKHQLLLSSFRSSVLPPPPTVAQQSLPPPATATATGGGTKTILRSALLRANWHSVDVERCVHIRYSLPSPLLRPPLIVVAITITHIYSLNPEALFDAPECLSLSLSRSTSCGHTIHWLSSVSSFVAPLAPFPASPPLNWHIHIPRFLCPFPLPLLDSP